MRGLVEKQQRAVRVVKAALLMDACGISKIESPWFALTIQKNPESVDIFDEQAIPEQFKEQVISWKIDKTAIKNALKSGEIVKGAILTQGSRLVIR